MVKCTGWLTIALASLVAWSGCKDEPPPTVAPAPKSSRESDRNTALDGLLANTLAIQEQAATVMESAATDPDGVRKRLRKLKEDTRLERARLRRAGRAAMKSMSKQESIAFARRAGKLHGEKQAALNRAAQSIKNPEKRRAIIRLLAELTL